MGTKSSNSDERSTYPRRTVRVHPKIADAFDAFCNRFTFNKELVMAGLLYHLLFENGMSAQDMTAIVGRLYDLERGGSVPEVNLDLQPVSKNEIKMLAGRLEAMLKVK